MHNSGEFACPRCDSREYKRHGLPQWIWLHWVINPVTAINEILMGMCAPTQGFECLSCDVPLIERYYVWCPHCQTAHDGRIWGKTNGFGHWLGFVCPDCGGQIPRLWNICSLLFLAATAPLWWIPVRLGRKRWLALEQKRAREAREALPTLPPLAQQITKTSLMFGISMWVIIVSFDLWKARGDIKVLLFMLPVCIGGGFLFGHAMHWWANQRPRKN